MVVRAMRHENDMSFFGILRYAVNAQPILALPSSYIQNLSTPPMPEAQLILEKNNPLYPS